MNRLSMSMKGWCDTNVQNVHHAMDGIPTGLCFPTERAVEIFSVESSSFSYVSNSVFFDQEPQSFDKQLRVFIIKAFNQESVDLFLGFDEIKRIVWIGFFCHGSSLNQYLVVAYKWSAYSSMSWNTVPFLVVTDTIWSLKSFIGLLVPRSLPSNSYIRFTSSLTLPTYFECPTYNITLKVCAGEPYNTKTFRLPSQKRYHLYSFTIIEGFCADVCSLGVLSVHNTELLFGSNLEVTSNQCEALSVAFSNLFLYSSVASRFMPHSSMMYEPLLSSITDRITLITNTMAMTKIKGGKIDCIVFPTYLTDVENGDFNHIPILLIGCFSLSTLALCIQMVDTSLVAAKSATGRRNPLLTKAHDASLLMLVFYCVRLSTSKNYGGLGGAASAGRFLGDGIPTPVQFTTIGVGTSGGGFYPRTKEAIMPNLISSSEVVSSIHVENDHAYVTSNDLALIFGKSHHKVLRDIQSLDCSDEFRESNFGLSSYRAGNRQYKNYHITRDGFTFLAMGFTGKKAAKFKEAYINAFNEMEERLKAGGQSVSTVPVAQEDILMQFMFTLRDLNRAIERLKDTYPATIGYAPENKQTPVTLAYASVLGSFEQLVHDSSPLISKMISDECKGARV